MRVKLILAATAMLLAQLAPANAAPLVSQEKKVSDRKPTYTIELAYPRTGHRAIDNEIESWVRELAQDFASAAKDQEPTPAGPWAANLTYEIGRNDGAMFSVLFSNYTYMGGAHPNTVFEAFNFLLPEGSRVELAELVTRRGIERVSAMSIAQLKQTLGGPDGMSDIDWITRGAGANAKNFRNFLWQPQLLVIHFDPYQVAAYAAGPQEVRIPLSRLSDVVRADPRMPAASFDCAKAASDVEQQICASRELARLDRHVSEAYAEKVLWAADEAARAKLKETQRAWLKHRDETCRRVRTAMTACLTQVHQERFRVLTSAP